MLYVLVGLIVAVVLIVVYGAWMRKKMFAKIDRAEERRASLMSRPIAKELSRVKQLNMAGDTEAKFDKWHKDWDTIVTQSLPEVEEVLFNAEELTEKYRFHKSELLVREMGKKMDQIEKRIEAILSELNMIVDSETKNREDVTPLKELYHQMKREMITKRSQFGATLPSLEQSLKEVGEQLKKYETETENGNYLDARQILISVRAVATELQERIDKVPDLYRELKKDVPEQMKELRRGVREMAEQGYSLEHLQVDEQLDEAEKHRDLLETAVDHLELDEAAEGLKAIRDQLEWLYGQLEKEAVCRSRIQEMAPSLEKDIDRISGKVSGLNKETELIRDSYHITDEELKTQHGISQSFQKLADAFTEAQNQEQHDEAFSAIFDRLDRLKESLTDIETVTDEFREKIKALRKDEMDARTRIKELKRQLYETQQLILKSNLPGVPGSFASALQKASEQLASVGGKLNEKPLNMVTVGALLQQANQEIDDVRQQAEKLVDTAGLAEEMIQYGNRYRTENSEIDQELRKAEQYFRNYDYQAAVETAVRAVEKKEPKILKRTGLFEDHDA